MPVKERGYGMAMYNSQGTPIIDDHDLGLLRHSMGNIAVNGDADVTLTTYLSMVVEVTIVWRMSALPTTGKLFIGQTGSLLNDSNSVERFDYLSYGFAAISGNQPTPTDRPYTIKRTFNGLQGITIRNELNLPMEGTTIIVVPPTVTSWRKNGHF